MDLNSLLKYSCAIYTFVAEFKVFNKMKRLLTVLSRQDLIMYLPLALILLMEGMYVGSIQARRINTRIKKPPTQETVNSTDYRSGKIIRVTSDSTDALFRLSQFSFTGYDKPSTSDTETFFITNNTAYQLIGIDIEIEYLSADSTQFHKRMESISVNVPEGETRQVKLRSWDIQHSFHFKNSRTGRNATYPYIVIFHPIEARLRQAATTASPGQDGVPDRFSQTPSGD